MNENLIETAYGEYLIFILNKQKIKKITLSNDINLYFYTDLLANFSAHKKRQNIRNSDIVLFCENQILTKDKFTRVTGLDRL